jgi:hypothetical protein
MVPSRSILAACAAFASLASVAAQAETLKLRVTVQNLAPANSVAYAPLRVGFHSGSYDAFDEGEAATAPIISVAEGGSGADWFPAFAAADPTATLGTVVPNPPGPLLPGGKARAVFTIDTAVNPFFTFAAMVVPSNDYFIGNDDPQQYRLFDAAGALLIDRIDLRASDIWDAGSEADDPANAAFVVGGNNDLRTPQNGVVAFDFEGLSIFDGLQTPAGYTFLSQLNDATGIYRINFALASVPEPSGLAMLAFGLFLAVRLVPAARRATPRA